MNSNSGHRVPPIALPRQQGPPAPYGQPRKPLQMGVAGFSGSSTGIEVASATAPRPAPPARSMPKRPQTATVQRKPATDAPTNEAQGLETEYIANLQQQIYFLELETNLLKERQAQESARHKGLGALDELLPQELGDRLKALAVQYRQLEEKSHNLVEAAEERAAAAEEQARTSKREVEVLEQSRDSLREQIERMRSESLVERERQHNEVAHLNDMINQLNKTIEQQKEDVKHATEQHEADAHKIVELNGTIEENERQLAEADHDNNDANSKLIEMERSLATQAAETAKLNEEKEYYHGREELAKALDERAEFELQVRKLTIELESITLVSEKMKETANQKTEENVDLLNRLRQTEIALQSGRADELWDGDVVGERRIAELLVEKDDMNKRLDLTEIELSDARREAQTLQNRVNELSSDLTEKLKIIETLKDEEQRAIQSEARMQESQQDLRDAAAARGGEVGALKANISDLQTELEATNVSLDESRNKAVALEEKCRRLSQIARASKLMETLRVDDVDSLVESSSQVTQTMKGLSDLLREFKGE